jgi:hypothetical protein
MCKAISQNYTQPAAARNMKPANPTIHSHLLTRLRPDEDPGKRARHVAAASYAVVDPRRKKDYNKVFDGTEGWKEQRLLFGILPLGQTKTTDRRRRRQGQSMVR